MQESIVISLKNISKDYILKKEVIHALNDVSVVFESGKFYAIMGHSGSGKSTLVSIIGLLESITKGNYEINGIDITKFNSDELADIRRDKIGFVFQEFYLDDYLKAYENVMFPMLINKNITKEERKTKAINLLEMVGMEKRIDHYPKELSGGEKQRVAIARSLANNPQIIIADEPTGDLDEDN